MPEQDEALLSNSEQISYPEGFPQDFLLTGFHALLLYKTHVSVVSLLTHAVVFQDFFTNPDGSDDVNMPL